MSAVIRYHLQNLGQLGNAGESLFSVAGIPLASRLIEEGWIPCGMHINERGEVLQSFYLPPEAQP